MQDGLSPPPAPEPCRMEAQFTCTGRPEPRAPLGGYVEGPMLQRVP